VRDAEIRQAATTRLATVRKAQLPRVDWTAADARQQLAGERYAQQRLRLRRSVRT
jgi:hypothetical protein